MPDKSGAAYGGTTDVGGQPVVKCRSPRCLNLAHPLYNDYCENCWNDVHRDLGGHQMMSRVGHKATYGRTQKQNRSE